MFKVGDKVTPFKKTSGIKFLLIEDYTGSGKQNGFFLRDNGFLYVIAVNEHAGFYTLSCIKGSSSGDYFNHTDLKGTNEQLEFNF
jgi:hypothetical protein